MKKLNKHYGQALCISHCIKAPNSNVWIVVLENRRGQSERTMDCKSYAWECLAPLRSFNSIATYGRGFGTANMQMGTAQHTVK